jgi:nicotinamidase-related amidase
VRDVLLLVDLIQTFDHEEGDALLESFRQRHGAILEAIESAREAELPVIYANDNHGIWDGDAKRAIDAKEEGYKVTILANACATTDEAMERLAFEYAAESVGALVERGR